jgi:hypothetical protein
MMNELGATHSIHQNRKAGHGQKKIIRMFAITKHRRKKDSGIPNRFSDYCNVTKTVTPSSVHIKA